MGSALRVQALFGQRALLLTTAAVPLTGWTVHAIALHRRLAAARRDPLTGLHSRPGYVQHAPRLLNRHGDKTMPLEEWVGDDGVAARLHGDEFAAVLACPAADRAHRLEQLHTVLHRPVDVDGQAVDVAVSIGASSPSDLHSRNLSYVLRGAEGAMYEHKRERTGLYRIATPGHANEPTVNGRRLGRAGTTAHSLASEDLR
ncbi:diguanylate cyclase domain-containing protein [Streptomyces sp. MBT62]|uniref:diguanylate cyclase domain-containing protein n=1 Tax=Streptomyces sp. MBT62 TaxID=2800410 RepID=UPI001909A377|nr:diguanylate cyclase [Streptomyces sp. MBT62]MBK3567831.1 diguanylate cyclase [Streptomyces sp. MBT62]